MAKLLYIEASPRKQRSTSIAVAKAFLEAYREANPTHTVEVLDLWKEKLPSFDGFTIDAKYAVLHGEPHTPEQRAAWSEIEKAAAKFKAADKYLISTPMWNFSIPYVLKHYIDVLVQPGLTFSYSPAEGYKGLVVGKPIAVIYARGGAYGSGTGREGFDLQIKYVELLLQFIGFKNITSILAEPTLAPGNTALETAKGQAVELGKRF
jgi:FMN-dependent NADH-azoreductase